MKQTAVEWLVEQMFKQGYFDGNKPLTYTNLDHLQNQAKAMEKELIIETFKYAQTLHAMGDETRAEQYYNKTYGGKNEI